MSTLARMRVMVIDDQSTSRTILEGLLKTLDEDLEVLSFADPLEALEWARSHAPDLVLTDYRMPGMDGLELIHRLRELDTCEDVPLLVITVIDDPAVRYQALEAGVTDVLAKPLDHQECRSRARNLLRQRRRQQALHSRVRWLEHQVAESTTVVLERERDALMRLARAGTWCEDPSGRRALLVGAVGAFIGARLGLREEECATLELACMLHDVGKVAVPEQVLLKPGRLTAEEFAVVRRHTEVGRELLTSQSPSPALRVAAQVAGSHHERFDGSGYPEGLTGDAIPLAARIAAVADVYEALTAERPYKPAIGHAQAVAYLASQRGQAFDPECVGILTRDARGLARLAAEHGRR